MKMLCRFFALLALLLAATHPMAAQCANWNDSPRKSEAQMAYLTYRPMVSGKKVANLEKMQKDTFNLAFDNWKKAYDIAPAADGQRPSIYMDGRLFYRVFFNRSTDEAKKKDHARTILRLYDEEMKCYDNEAYLLGRKGYDMFYDLGYGHSDQTFEVLKMALEKGGTASEAMILKPTAEVAVQRYKSKKLNKEGLQAIYDKINACIQYNLEHNVVSAQTYIDAQAEVKKIFDKIEGLRKG